MRIAYVITRLARGGAALEVLADLAACRAAGLEGFLVAGTRPGPEGDLGPRALEAGLEVVRVEALVREVSPPRDLAAALAVARVLARRGVDLVHTHTSKAGVVGRAAAVAAGVRGIVHSPHGLIYGLGSAIPGVSDRPFLARALAHVERAANRWTDRVVALTEDERRAMVRLRLARASRVVVLGNAVDTGLFERAAVDREGARLALGLPVEGPVVAAVGRMSREKGHQVLLAALARLNGGRTAARLVLAGDGPDRAALETQARGLGLGGRVVFLGATDEVPRVLAAADVVAHPSHYEGFGLVLLEAMAAGRPVVASRVGGIPEVVEEGRTGLLVPPGDPEAMALALGRVLDDPGLARRMGEAGARRARAYDRGRKARRLVALYEEVLRGRAR
ncbi:MAG: glycosyltransferase [Planctomycetes bacterium]|nr:glycosyltransferase [Planctomycetota bacterium]